MDFKTIISIFQCSSSVYQFLCSKRRPYVCIYYVSHAPYIIPCPCLIHQNKTFQNISNCRQLHSPPTCASLAVARDVIKGGPWRHWGLQTNDAFPPGLGPLKGRGQTWGDNACITIETLRDDLLNAQIKGLLDCVCVSPSSYDGGMPSENHLCYCGYQRAMTIACYKPNFVTIFIINC